LHVQAYMAALHDYTDKALEICHKIAKVPHVDAVADNY
jgi:hypothetical protein